MYLNGWKKGPIYFSIQVLVLYIHPYVCLQKNNPTSHKKPKYSQMQTIPNFLMDHMSNNRQVSVASAPILHCSHLGTTVRLRSQ